MNALTMEKQQITHRVVYLKSAIKKFNLYLQKKMIY